MSRVPIRTKAECDALDPVEMIDGYNYGRAGEPEPGDNQSLSFWHGWRNGAVDGGHRLSDAAQEALARDYLSHPIEPKWGRR
jgi:hypothetical protein